MLYIQGILFLLLLLIGYYKGYITLLFSFSISAFSLFGAVYDLFKLVEGYTIILWLLIMTVLIFLDLYRKGFKLKPFQKREEFLEIFQGFWPWMLFLGYLLLQTFIIGNNYGLFKIGVSILQGLLPAGLFLFYLLCSNRDIGREKSNLEDILFYFGLILSVMTIIAFFISNSSRTVVLGMNPIWLARDIAIAAIALFLSERKISLKMVYLPVLLAGIYFTGSRGPMLSLLFVLLLMALYSFMKNHSFRKYLPYLLILFLLVSFSGYHFFAEDFLLRGSESVFAENSAGTRLKLYQQALENFKDYPLFGSGFGTYSFSDRFNYPHNQFLELMAEGGIIALLLFIYALKPWMTLHIKYSYSYFLIFALLSSMLSGDLAKNSFIIPLALLVLFETHSKKKVLS
ncbi:MAG: O-antigen ligase family protein [bacterium]